MQFRPVSGKVQCYAAWYDKETKRGRQKLVYSLERYGRIFQKPSADDLTPADFGTPEQRQGWAAEIATYIDQRNEEHERARIESISVMLRGAVDRIVADRDSPSPVLSAEQLEEIKNEVRRLGPALGLMVADMSSVMGKSRAKRKKQTPIAPGEDPRAFGGELVDRAKALRAEGFSIATTAEKLTAEGHAVSKSWVQKWTA